MRTFLDYEKGLFEKHEKIYRHKRCHTITVKSDCPLRVELDGESFYAPDIKLEIIQGGIRFFAPESISFKNFSDRAYRKKEAEK